MNKKNAERLTQSFRKMRGAALKVGQLLSTQEESVMPPVFKEALEKARSEADIMPKDQVIASLSRNFGADWQKNFKEINLYPFAAASIGQVHEGVLSDGRHVAIKMQYDGVRDSIDSDLDNLKRVADMFSVFPRGLYIDEVIRVTRKELHWECDYDREAMY